MDPLVLPEPGDVVDVMVGSDRLRGRVLQSYSSGAQPRVLIELDRRPDSEERVTIAVPPASLEPAESTHSPWAEGQRYESEFADAVKRLFQSISVERQSPFVTPRADFTLSTGARRAVVEIKYSQKPISRGLWESLFKRLSRAAIESHSSALIVTNSDVNKSLVVPADVRVVRWNNRRDDNQLKTALADILAIPD